MSRLANKCALITGGGRGIGRATAFRFAREGARVGIMGKGEASLARAKADAAAEGLTIATYLGDVGTKEDVTRVVDAFARDFGRIDILVNNAGLGRGARFMDKTVEEWNDVLRVNLIGTFLMAQAAAKHMLAAKSGKIVNISSVRGLDTCGREGTMDYSAAKAGVINLTKTMAKELAPHINVNVVLPGHTDTDVLRSLAEEVRANMLAGTYLRRFAHVDDIANAILFLSSSESDFITGQQILVDGGFSLKAG